MAYSQPLPPHAGVGPSWLVGTAPRAAAPAGAGAPAAPAHGAPGAAAAGPAPPPRRWRGGGAARRPLPARSFPATDGSGGDVQDTPLFRSPIFMLTCFKVVECDVRRPYGWAQCPYAHPNEKGRRRPLDPPRLRYAPTMCAFARRGEECPEGDACAQVGARGVGGGGGAAALGAAGRGRGSRASRAVRLLNAAWC
ncbi:hypothetical protein Rsub_04196 [Raphidocelis subcapitata]|uniref:AtC3H23-like CCCH zinc finger domain-containing protein n=1 Tax=Raphidocelis subcapitata TaxID=307507 RepID=A0A2V0NUZ9_9CHLO|nr:hypothetical protein Rsub_04196 [Raphidocelis subcapitata]|eukprot:GBF91456.1 hypothetical protein Rsub_04196 [Raphidocelis subcapitata]